MDKLENMRTFVQVVDSGSFSRAAELMDLPKSTVTRQVQALESELGVKLLHRDVAPFKHDGTGRSLLSRSNTAA